MAVTKAALRRRWNTLEARHVRAQETLLRVLEEALRDLGDDYNLRPLASISGEMKTFEAFVRKALRFEADERVCNTDECFEEIRDVVRARVTCQTLSDVERVRQMIRDNDVMSVKREKDFDVKARTSTGYRALHINAFVETSLGGKSDPVACEVQVQTSLQYAWGLFTHSDFYKGDEVPPLVRDLMIQLSDLLHVADCVADQLIREVEAAA